MSTNQNMDMNPFVSAPNDPMYIARCKALIESVENHPQSLYQRPYTTDGQDTNAVGGAAFQYQQCLIDSQVSDFEGRCDCAMQAYFPNLGTY